MLEAAQRLFRGKRTSEKNFQVQKTMMKDGFDWEIPRPQKAMVEG